MITDASTFQGGVFPFFFFFFAYDVGMIMVSRWWWDIGKQLFKYLRIECIRYIYICSFNLYCENDSDLCPFPSASQCDVVTETFLKRAKNWSNYQLFKILMLRNKICRMIFFFIGIVDLDYDLWQTELIRRLSCFFF